MWDVLAYCKRRLVTTISYHLDLYIGLQRQEGLNNDPFWATDFVFTPDGDPYSAKVFKQRAINHYWMKPGVFKEECYVADVPITRDVIFVGSRYYHQEWPYRPRLIQWLRDTYSGRFEHWGHDGLGSVRGDALNRLYASTKVVVGDSLCLPAHTNYWSDRPYETMGRGGVLIMPKVPGLEREFTDKKDLMLYNFDDFGQLKDSIDYLLDNEVEREFMRQQGHMKVKGNYTYNERLTEMLDMVANTRGKK